MGFFSKKKKSTPSSSPAFSSSPTMPSAPVVPQIVEPVDPPMTLSVVLDGWRREGDEQCFTIDISKEADTTILRHVLASKLGDVSISLFKVAIPKIATEQARRYTELYQLPVDLITVFPAFNVDDVDQLVPSLGPAAWSQVGKREDLRMKDWFPEPVLPDVITLLVRRADGPSTSIPTTFAVHIAQPGAMSRANRPTTPGGGVVRQPPTVVDIAPGASIASLKSAILSADARSTEESEQLVLWRVEMSEDEMIVIEERGGLKNGQMPWPYPPTAPVPSGMTDSSLPISHYFPTFASNPRIITISAYIPSSASSLLKRSIPTVGETAPAFRYPMVFPQDWTPATAPSFNLSMNPRMRAKVQSPPVATPSTPLSPELGATPKIIPRPQRPSTAPIQSSDGVKPFGAGSRRMGSRPNIGSPLIESTTPSPISSPNRAAKGLGINTSQALDQHRGRGSCSSNGSSTSNVSSDAGSVPSLDFSTLSLDEESPTSSISNGTRSAVQTPVTEKSEWVQVNSSLVVPKGLERAQSVQRVSKWGRLAGRVYQ